MELQKQLSKEMEAAGNTEQKENLTEEPEQPKRQTRCVLDENGFLAEGYFVFQNKKTLLFNLKFCCFLYAIYRSVREVSVFFSVGR